MWRLMIGYRLTVEKVCDKFYSPFDLGIPQIINLSNTIALFRVNFNRLDRVIYLVNSYLLLHEMIAALMQIWG